MRDVIEASYTGDILAHRRCRRAWAYEKHVGFHKYEQSQAMEGRLVHHAMEWLTTFYRKYQRHAAAPELEAQLHAFFRVLWARGIRTQWERKQDVLDRVRDRLFPQAVMHATVQHAIEGAAHIEYELRAVHPLPPHPGRASKLLLTGVMDLVLRQTGFTYPLSWVWKSLKDLDGEVREDAVTAAGGEVEIWDYKATSASTGFMADYVLQLLTYGGLYAERAGALPVRGVLFFINESDPRRQLLSVVMDPAVVQAALRWTITQISEIQDTIDQCEQDPLAVSGGELALSALPRGQKITAELRKQCTGCSWRFDCDEYRTHVGDSSAEVDIYNVFKN
jgi:hypothetical protein